MLSPDAQLGHYRIVSLLGVGGMGEVYRAHDGRLGREVAVKLLPPAFSRDSERLRRFEQEARTLAGLNHPNLLALYDIGTHDGSPYLVTELLEGETLRARLGRGPIPVRKTVEVSRQLAEGLAAAHEKGIIHRDLKPENIYITRDERVKILDFGLAKLALPESSPEAATMAGLSTPGLVLGTASYMAPEQVRAQAVDARSDLFALGATMYEMLTGQRAFERGSAVETMSAILNAEPAEPAEPWPVALDRIVRRCLEKEPARRFQSARDLAFALEQTTTASSQAHTSLHATAPVAEPSKKPAQPAWIALAAACLILAAVFGWLWWRARGAAPALADERFVPFSFAPGGSRDAAWSPDGKAVAYSAAERQGEPMQVWVRQVDSPVPLQLTHSADDCSVIGWTAQGAQILFFAAPMTATPTNEGTSLQTVSPAGGEPETLPLSAVKWNQGTLPVLTRNGRALLVLASIGENTLRLWISDPVGSPLRRYEPDPFATATIINNPSLATNEASDRILLMLDAGQGNAAWLMRYPPDPKQAPRRVMPVLSQFQFVSGAAFLPDGHHLILGLRSSDATAGQLWLGDINGAMPAPITIGTTALQYPRLSPDGRQLVTEENNSSSELVSVSLQNAAVSTLLPSQRSEIMPVWAEKAPVLAYVTTRNGPAEIWVHEPSRPDRPVVTSGDFNDPTQGFMGPSLSPDGQRLIYTRVSQQHQGGVRLYMSSVAGGSALPLIASGPPIQISGSWSPDGGNFAYLGLDQAGDVQLMVAKTSGAGAGRMLAKGAAGVVPAWSPKDDWIQYCDQAGALQLISPDASRHKALGKCDSSAFAFSADGAQLYGLRSGGGHLMLFARDVASGAERVIGDAGLGNEPVSGYNPAIRLSLAPDGKSLAYSVARTNNNLWLLEGFPTTGTMH